MKKFENFKCVAITGGIGVGKSMVMTLLEGVGYKTVSVDLLARELLKDSCSYHSAYMAKLDSWLGTTYSVSGVDRDELNSLVVQQEHGLETVRGMAKPYVELLLWEKCNELGKESNLIIVEVPLLIELGWQKKFEIVVVVCCSEEKKLERLRLRGMTDIEIQRRVASQVSDGDRLKIADYVLDNSGDSVDLKKNVEELVGKLF